MTGQEQELIDGLVERVKSAPVQDKDDEADRYLHSKLDAAPDSLYVLAQTVLVQQYGLSNAQGQLQEAQAQIADLQDQLAQAQAAAAHPKSGSFLGKLLGTDAQPQYQPVNTGYAAPPPPGYGYGQPVGYGYGAPPVSGGGGFLRGALQTAAGVAAGAMVFQGMEDLFRGFGGGGREGFGSGQSTEVINNNYYDEPRGGEPEHHAAEAGDSSVFYDPAHDASRQDDSQNAFADTSSNDGSFDDGDDGSNDFDDSGSDGGGSDDGGF